MARYAVRAPVAIDRVSSTDAGQVLLEIPPDPKTGATVLVLDPLEWVRRITNQIPDPRMHMTRFYLRQPPRLCRGKSVQWTL